MTQSGVNFAIVVPTRNRPENVKNLLASIERSTIHPARCVVVDSSDFHYDLPTFSFPVLLATPKIVGQVGQRNYGVRLLNEGVSVDYVFTLDDDIIVEPESIGAALNGIRNFERIDHKFVGFALNIINMGSSASFFRRCMLYPRRPGVVTKSAFNSSLGSLESDMECDWVVGGAAVWRMDFISKNPSDYPFAGKAYAEDLYYCAKVRSRARFGAICNAKCSHLDSYGTRASGDVSYTAYREGFSDSSIRIHIAKIFPQFCAVLAVFHMLWVGLLGVGHGILFLDRAAFFLGVGRVAGCVGLVQSRKLAPYGPK